MEEKKNGEPSKKKSLIKSIADLLNEIIIENTNNLDAPKGPSSKEKEAIVKDKPNVKYFTSKKPPSITIYNYLERILKYTKIEDSTMIITLIYIDKLCENHDIQLTPLNIHRIILATVVLAIKYNEDNYYSNEFYAKVGGVTMLELNTIEKECLNMLDHALFVYDDNYFKYYSYLVNYSD